MGSGVAVVWACLKSRVTLWSSNSRATRGALSVSATHKVMPQCHTRRYHNSRTRLLFWNSDLPHHPSPVTFVVCTQHPTGAPQREWPHAPQGHRPQSRPLWQSLAHPPASTPSPPPRKGGVPPGLTGALSGESFPSSHWALLLSSSFTAPGQSWPEQRPAERPRSSWHLTTRLSSCQGLAARGMGRASRQGWP